VLRYTIKASPDSDVTALVDHLAVRATAANLDSQTVELLTRNTRTVLTALVEQGRALAANGSAMNVTRDLSGPGFKIAVVFGSQRKRGFLARLLGN